MVAYYNPLIIQGVALSVGLRQGEHVRQGNHAASYSYIHEGTHRSLDTPI